MPRIIRGKTNWRRTALLWSFPLVLWALSTGYFGFDLGKYSDDWSQTFISPDTGRFDQSMHPFVRWPFFFRPVYFVAAWAMNTAFWEHDWARHLIAALTHLGVGVLLFRFLRLAGLRDSAAIAATALFLTCPVQCEAVLWPAAVGLPAGTMCFLLAASMVVRFARQQPNGRPWGRLAAMAGMTFLAACWHEQTAACTAAAPLLYLACCPADQPWIVRGRRAVLATLACGAACAAYGALLIGTAPAGRRGSGASLIGLSGADQRLTGFADQVADWLFGSRFVDAAINPGVRGLEELLATHLGWAWLGVAGIGGAAWLVAFGREGDRDGCSARDERTRHAWLIAFGLCVAVFGLLPIAVTRGNGVFSRYFYPVTLGAMIALGAILDAAWCFVDRRGAGASRVWSMAVGVVIAAACVFRAGAMVGWQMAYRERAREDLLIAQGLRRAAPTPPRGAVFVPIGLGQRGPWPSATYPNGPVPSALSQPWACWAFIQRAYGRSDVSATHWRPGSRPPVTMDERGVSYGRALTDVHGRAEPAGRVIPWAQAVVFTVAADGGVRVLSPEEAGQTLRDSQR